MWIEGYIDNAKTNIRGFNQIVPIYFCGRNIRDTSIFFGKAGNSVDAIACLDESGKLNLIAVKRRGGYVNYKELIKQKLIFV